MKHMEAHGILADQQRGFRKRRSCESQLIKMAQDLAAGLHDGEQIDAVLLDFSKAFDKVPHERLATKLHHYGIRGQLLQWISSFLANRSQQVLVEGQSSPTAPVTSGVPQGTVLGPILFLVYINDLPSRVSSTCRRFTDDSLLYRIIRSPEDQEKLQEDLDIMHDWKRDWLMAFNPTKCDVLPRRPIHSNYRIHGQIGKILGVTLSEKLSWNLYVDAVTKSSQVKFIG